MGITGLEVLCSGSGSVCWWEGKGPQECVLQGAACGKDAVVSAPSPQQRCGRDAAGAVNPLSLERLGASSKVTQLVKGRLWETERCGSNLTFVSTCLGDFA